MEIVLCDTVKVGACHYTFVQTPVTPDLDYRCLVIIMYQCRLINSNKRTTLLETWEQGAVHACGGGWGYENAAYFPVNFAVNIKLL